MRHTLFFNALSLSAAALTAYMLAWACGFVLPTPAALLGASFIVNLGLLATALALLPDNFGERQWAHLRALGFAAALIVCAYAGLWLYGVRAESPRVFIALAAITLAHATLLAAIYAVAGVCGCSERVARTLCGVLLAAVATAFFWTRPPILNSGSPERASAWITGVMSVAPPAGVAAAWYSGSDAALGAQPDGRRFDLVRAPRTYAVWIGSYDAVAYPEILPRGITHPGLAAILLCFALPILAACEAGQRRRFT